MDIETVGFSYNLYSSPFTAFSGMADRGNGIRLFNSRQSLVDIFQAFEDPDSEEDEASSTSVVTSQLRDFVVQVFHLPT